VIVLGLESSCDETAAAVVRDGRVVLSSVVASQTEIHAEYAGVVPELASRAHVERMLPVVREALARAGVGVHEVDAVAVGNRPGLIGCLLVAVGAGKALAWALGKPLVGVDHVHAHLISGALVEVADGATKSSPTADSVPAPARLGGGASGASGHALDDGDVFPALGLVVSGGHTSLYALRSWTALERLGATIDDAMGEAFDKAATVLGLPFPGGPALDRLAQTPGADAKAVAFPVSRIAPASLDFSFSGLKTAMLYAAKGVPTNPRRGPNRPGYEEPAPPPPLTEGRRADLAASFQEAAVRAVVIKLERALERMKSRGAPVRTLVTGGGVTANSALRRELVGFAERRGLRLLLPPLRYCVDNAAMIAALGAELLREGRVAGVDLQAVPTTGV
jgi:N6-L-threonylcarbamoyladenine synthase